MLKDQFSFQENSGKNNDGYKKECPKRLNPKFREHSVKFSEHSGGFLSLMFKSLYFEIILDLQKSCMSRTESSHILFTIHLIITSHIPTEQLSKLSQP